MRARLLAAAAGTLLGSLLLAVVLPRRCTLVAVEGVPWWLTVLPLLLTSAPLAVAVRQREGR